jgi:quercetin dioxygenase-like cupin family protein
MGFYADNIDTALIDADALPWVPFVPYTDKAFLKMLKIDPVRGEWIVLLKLPAGMDLPRHHHSGTVHVYTLEGAWKYKEHDWIARPGSFVFETAASAHTPIALDEGDVVVFNIVVGDWILLDDKDQVLAIENWKTMFKRYTEYCRQKGIKPVDISSFAV